MSSSVWQKTFFRWPLVFQNWIQMRNYWLSKRQKSDQILALSRQILTDDFPLTSCVSQIEPNVVYEKPKIATAGIYRSNSKGYRFWGFALSKVFNWKKFLIQETNEEKDVITITEVVKRDYMYICNMCRIWILEAEKRRKMWKYCCLFYIELCYNNLFKKTINQGWSQEDFNPANFEKACSIHSIDKWFVTANVYTDWIVSELKRGWLQPWDDTENYTIETTELANNEKFIWWMETLYKIFFLCYNEFRMLKSWSPVKAIIVG